MTPADTGTPVSAWQRWLAPATIVLLMIFAYALGLQRYLSLESLAENRMALQAFTEAHLLLALLAFVAVYALSVALSFPGAAILTVAGGFLFGWFLGGLAAVVAATLGAVAVFQIARSTFGERLARRAGPALARITEGFSADAFNYLLFLRLVPAFPFWLVNIAPAFARVRLRTFTLATFLGIMPGSFAFAFVGGGLDSVLEAQMQRRAACLLEKTAEQCPFDLALASLITKELLFAFAALGLVALIPVALRKWKSRHEV
ncbi:MAG: TVP38/TMEM64 family protein [Proteobacteria bacterium]|nr:TVP38/TMEM64 family protein [Pseudomonadota bacterium]